MFVNFEDSLSIDYMYCRSPSIDYIYCRSPSIDYMYCRSYVDGQGKKKVNFSEKLNSKIAERPKSPVIKDMQHYILPKIEESFNSYLIVSTFI